MNIIITMAGAGSRFRDAGYSQPKYQIEAHGKTLFAWSLMSLTDYLPDGQAATALLGIRQCPPEEPVMIYNIDTYIEPNEMRFEQISGAGYIPCFLAEGTHWSFVRLDENGRAVEVAEKKRISGNCSLGAYYFASAALYLDAYDRLYGAGWDGAREKYIAPMYNLLIADGREVRISLVNPERVHVLGTPEELNAFLALPLVRVSGETR